MTRPLIIGFLFILSFNAESQNLISNPDFEQNGNPYCDGWFDGCRMEFKDHCDSLYHCGTSIIHDSAPDTMPGEWCLKVYGDWPVSNAATTYITNRMGTFIYQLKFWMNTEHFIGEAYLGTIKNLQIENYNLLSDSGQPWTQYSLLDTITTTATDTIGVLLGAAVGDFCQCDVAFDQIELTVIDSLSTGIESHNRNQEYQVFPNPFSDHLTISAPDSHGFNMILFDMNGKQIKTETSPDDKTNIDMTSIPQGIYYFELSPLNISMSPGYGKIIKQ